MSQANGQKVRRDGFSGSIEYVLFAKLIKSATDSSGSVARKIN